MIVRFLRLSWLVVFLCPLADAQQAANEASEMRFVEALRKQGFADLAKDYLEKELAKKPGLSKEFLAELPIEIVKTQLDLIADEPDASKKIALFGDIRGKLQKFLKDNPTSRRASEVELDIAEVAVLQGRAALTQAIMLDESNTRETVDRQKARALLVEAGKELITVAKKLEERLKLLPDPKTPAEKAQRARLEQTEQLARFNVALNLFDQGSSYPRDSGKKVLAEARNARMEACVKQLEQFVGLEDTNPLRWKSLAWLGRCDHELGTPAKARQRYAGILEVAGRQPAASEASRLAQYFRLLVIEEKADTGEDQLKLIDSGSNAWLKQYPRLVNSPEGCGIRFMLANNMLTREAASKDAKEKATLLAQARRLLTSLEATENEFSDRARRKKIQIIGAQGAFKKKVSELTTFEDCYVRAQYEQYELEKDPETIKVKTQLEAKQKEREDTIIAALTRGLSLPDATSKLNLLEANNAKTMLCYYHFNNKNYPACIAIGEKFALDYPNSGQAIRCASYALQAYSQLILSFGDDPEKGIEERKGMMNFAKECKKRWAKELPGDLARHQLALLYLREKNPEGAIAELEDLSPGYPSFAATQLLLAQQASKIASTEPEKAEAFRKRMLAALERVPETAKGDPLSNQAYCLIRTMLAEEMYNGKQYDRVEAIALPLEQSLAGTRFDENDNKDKEMRAYFQNRLALVKIYSRVGQASDAMSKNDFPKVAALLDPTVDQINDKKLDNLKGNPLVTTLLRLDMRANIQRGELDRTRKTVQALQAMADDAADGEVPPVMRELVGVIRQQIEELQKKGNQEALGKAINGFSVILEDVSKQQKKVNPEFQIVIAQCYTMMDKKLSEKAADLLRKIPEPPNKDDKARENDKDVTTWRSAQIQLIRALRAAEKKPEAAEALKAIMGDKDKPLWGRRDVTALREQLALYIEEEDYLSAYSLAQSLSKALAGRLDNPKMKEQYLDIYYNQVFALVRQGSKQKTEASKKRAMEDSARLIAALEQRFPDFGGPDLAKKFTDLLAGDPDLKAAYETVKPKK